MSNKARWEYFLAIYGRYQKGNRKVRQAILNEFCLNTGYHHKYAIRLLNGASPGPRASPSGVRRKRAQTYGRKTLAALTAVWEAAGYPWSVRLKAILPTWMPWIRKRFGIGPETEGELLAISPRQMDRRRRDQKMQARRRLYGHTKPGLLLKQQIAIKTENWDVRSSGFTEIDLVSHSGNSGAGEFGHTLNVTDIDSGWTESRAVLGRSQPVVLGAIQEVEQALPFALRGVVCDNGSEFINWHLRAWCQGRNIQLTRGRPYKEDNNAFDPPAAAPPDRVHDAMTLDTCKRNERMNLGTFHVHNVVNPNPAYSQRIGDERTVATPWNCLRTHNRDPLLPGQCHQSV